MPCRYFAPPYLYFLTPFPATYLLPLTLTLHSIFDPKHRVDRPVWQAFWVCLAVVEYGESVFFGNSIRGLMWWPVVGPPFLGTVRES
jgi:hypothetical protein